MSVEFLLLSHEDVLKCAPTMSEAIELVTKSLTAHGKKQIENPPKPGVHTAPNSFLHAMPAYVSGDHQICGLKWVGGYPGNREKGLPAITGMLVMNDATTGLPTAVMDATYITALRTAAVSGLAMKLLAGGAKQQSASPAAKKQKTATNEGTVLAIVGAGVQGKFHVLAAAVVLERIAEVRVQDAIPAATKAFVDSLSAVAELKDVKFTVCASPQEAIEGADVVVTAISPQGEGARLFDVAWCKRGALVLPVHTKGWPKNVAQATDLLFTDDWRQFSSFAAAEYDLPADKPSGGELGEVLVGARPGRTGADQLIIDFNVGLAIHDVVFGDFILAKAKKQKLGKQLTLAKQLNAPFPKLN